MTLNMHLHGQVLAICRRTPFEPHQVVQQQLTLVLRVSLKDTTAAEWDRDTWPALYHLAKNHPEAGVHFQGIEIYNRKKDLGSDTATWFADLLSPNPWWRSLFPDVSLS